VLCRVPKPPLRKSCLAGSQIVEVERLSRQQNDILKLGLAVLQQIAPQLRQTDGGHGGMPKIETPIIINSL
jgi:hypothetical protein